MLQVPPLPHAMLQVLPLLKAMLQVTCYVVGTVIAIAIATSYVAGNIIASMILQATPLQHTVEQDIPFVLR